MIGVVFENGALGMTAINIVEDWLTLEIGVGIDSTVVELEAPKPEDENSPLTGILVVTVEKKVVG